MTIETPESVEEKLANRRQELYFENQALQRALADRATDETLAVLRSNMQNTKRKIYLLFDLIKNTRRNKKLYCVNNC